MHKISIFSSIVFPPWFEWNGFLRLSIKIAFKSSIPNLLINEIKLLKAYLIK